MTHNPPPDSTPIPSQTPPTDARLSLGATPPPGATPSQPQTSPPGATPPQPQTPPTEPDYLRISPKFATIEYLGLALFCLPLLLVSVVLALWLSPWFWLIGVATLAFGIPYAVLIQRRVRAWGYAERADDLVITRGIMFRRTTVVPYGRLQFVDVEQGPFERMFGLAKIKIHTASAQSDATVPGLPKAEANRMRDHLSDQGRARLAGL